MTAQVTEGDSPGGKYVLFDQVPTEDGEGVELPTKTSSDSRGKDYLLDEEAEGHSVYVDEEGAISYDQRRKKRRWCWFAAAICGVLIIIMIMAAAYNSQSTIAETETATGSEPLDVGTVNQGEGNKPYPTGPVIVPTKEQKEAYEKQLNKTGKGKSDSNAANKGKGDWRKPTQDSNPLTLMSMAINGLYVKTFDYTWEPSTGRYTTVNSSGDLVAYDAGGQEQTLAYASRMKDNEGRSFSPSSYSFSHDSKFILFKVHPQKQWRHSDTADYMVFDREKQMAHPLTLSGKPRTTQVAQFSPKGHHVAFVRGNDVYVSWNLEHEVRLTNDGSHTIYNGVADWVYEEEVLSDTRAFWWSPDGTKLVYWRFDDARVLDYEIPYYFDQEPLDGRQQYSHTTKLKYPKPGTANPIVSIHIATLGPELKDKTSKVPPNSGREINAHTELTRTIPLDHLTNLHGVAKDILADDNHVFSRVDWMTTGNERFMLQVLSRVQDKSAWILVDVKDFTVKDADDESKPTFKLEVERGEERKDGWYDPQYVKGCEYLPKSTSGIDNENTYLQVEIHPDNGYEHIAMYKLGDKKPERWLTTGEWTVLADTVSVNHKTGRVLFVASVEGSTTRGVYMVNLSDKVTDKPTSVTPTDKPSYYNASFSPIEAELMILEYKGPDLPSTSVCDANAQDIYKTCRNLVSNDHLRDRMKRLGVPEKEFLEIDKDDYKLNVALYKPPGFTDDGSVRWPVILQYYGGPDSQEVSRDFDLFRPRSVMSSGLGVIVCVVDPRGTGFKGKDFRFRVKGKIGVLEAEDVLFVASWLTKQKYVDADRIGTWGWSYGGFLASKIAEQNADGIVKAAFAVAPVTDWRYYDSIYSERYMGTPKENENGYIASSVKATDGFNKTAFMVAHGSGDDNVHFLNTLALIRKLLRHSDTNYSMLIFPDSHHSMEFEGARSQLYVRIDQFFKKELDLDVENPSSPF